MKRKICYITTIALSIRAFFVPQMKYLAENGYDVTVVCSPDEKLQEELGENIRFIPVSIARGISPKTLLGSIMKLKKLFREEKFDIVQYSTPNAAFCASIAAWLAGVKIRNYHLMGLRYLGMSGVAREIFKIIERITCCLSTHIECVSNSNLELAVKEHIFKREKAEVVWNGSTGGVDLDRFSAAKRDTYRSEVRRELGLLEGEYVFGFVGRITKDKGVNELLSAFYGINKNCKLLIVGDKEGETVDAGLWERALKSKNIIIKNAVRDIERYYAAIDVLVLPCYREGLGMVIVEAAAMGTPVICSNIPGTVDAMKDGKTGFLVNVKDVGSLREKMEMFLNNPTLSKEMSEDCIRFIKNNFDSRILNQKIKERKDKLKV